MSKRYLNLKHKISVISLADTIDSLTINLITTLVLRGISDIMYFSYCKKCGNRYASASPFKYLINNKCQHCGDLLIAEKSAKQDAPKSNDLCPKSCRDIANGENT